MGFSLIAYPKVIYSQATTPSDTTAGRLWYDTSANSLKVSNGSSYASIGGATNAASGILGVYALLGGTGTPTAAGDLANATDDNAATKTSGWTWTHDATTHPDTEVRWDLGSNTIRSVVSVKADMISGAGLNWRIQVSQDGSAWTTLWSSGTSYSGTYNDPILLDIAEETFRYIRIFGDEAGYGGSFTAKCEVYELKVY